MQLLSSQQHSSRNQIWWYCCYVNIKKNHIVTGILIVIGSLRCLKEESQWTWNDVMLSVYFKIVFLNFSYICCSWRQFQCAPTTYVHSLNECFSPFTGFSQISQLLFMFQCNEHVERFCVVWHAPDSQFYIIDSLSIDVSFEWNVNLVVAWLYIHCMVGKKNNTSLVRCAYRKSIPWYHYFVNTLKASWCQTVIIITHFFFLWKILILSSIGVVVNTYLGDNCIQTVQFWEVYHLIYSFMVTHEQSCKRFPT